MIAAALVVALIGGGVAWARSATLRQPAIAALGAGNELALLVTDGEARILVLGAGDPAEFGNALGAAMPGPVQRIDVLVLAAGEAGVELAVAARRAKDVRRVLSAGPVSAAANTALGGVIVFEGSRRIALPGGTSVTVETTATIAAPVDDPAWRAVIRRGGTTVVARSDGAEATGFPPVMGVTAVLVCSGGLDDPPGAARTEAVVAPSAAFRPTASGWSSDAAWVMRVFPGETARLRFVEGGLRLPPESRRLEPGS